MELTMWHSVVLVESIYMYWVVLLFLKWIIECNNKIQIPGNAIVFVFFCLNMSPRFMSPRFMSPRFISKLEWGCFLFVCFFSIRLLSVLRGHSFLFIPATTANDLRLRRIFYPRFYPLHLFTYLNSWERASIFPFECSVLNKGTTGTNFYNVFGMTRSLTGHWVNSSVLGHWLELLRKENVDGALS